MGIGTLMLASLGGDPGAWGRVCEELRDALTGYARRHSPYYARIAPRDGDFASWPVLTRAALRDHLDEIVARGLPPERGQRGKTSGSTGTPTPYVLDTEIGPVHLGALAALRELHELPPESRLVRITTSPGQTTGYLPDWHLVSGHALTPAAIPRFLEDCAAPGDYFLYVRASLIAWVAEQLERCGITVATPPRGIVTTMDMLTASERRRTASVFGCPVRSWYGMQEICGFVAGTIQDGDSYAINPLVTYAEVLDDEDAPVGTGEIGRLVLTDLHNYAAPLIRYDTGDLARASDGSHGGWPVVEQLVGREADLLRLANGRTLSALELGYFLTEVGDLEGEVRGYQCLHRRSGEIEVRIVWRDPDTPRTEEAGAAVRSAVGEGVRVEVVSVTELESLPSGKRWIVRSE